MYVAICSTTGEKVDQQLDMSHKLYIYEVSDGNVDFKGTRLIISSEKENIDPSLCIYQTPLDAVKDCDVLYCFTINNDEAKILFSKQIEVRLTGQTLKQVFQKISNKGDKNNE